MLGILGVVLIAGGIAWFGSEAGWWSSTKGPTKPGRPDAAPTPARPSEARLADASASPSPPTVATPPPATAARTPDSAGGIPISVPRFSREFDEAIERGAFRDAEIALAKLGGAADAERRLGAAMESAATRIASRFEEIRAETGERAARVYVTHQLGNFPDRSEARGKLQALTAAPESGPTAPAPVARRSDSRSDTRTTEQPETVAPIDADLAATKEEGARVLETGDVKAALSVLREVATAAEARNQRQILFDAQRLIRQGEAEIRLRAAIIDRAGKKLTGDRPIPHLPGERGALLEANDEGLTFAGTQGKVLLKWRVLPVHSLLALIPMLELGPTELPDAAATLYRASKAVEADALLAKAAHAATPEVKRAIDQTLADARGIALPADGFKFVDDKWMSPQELARHDVAKSIMQSTKDLAAGDPAARKAAFDRMVKLGDAAKSPLNRALLLRRAEIHEEVVKAPIHAKLAELGARRREVDEARSSALELIEDETKYPYPYRPPEASAETFKQYEITQKEVDVRVAKLRGLWSQPLAVTVPKPFREKIASLAEIDGFLAQIGAAPGTPEPGWLMNLPQADEVTLQTVATSDSDRHRIDESAETMHVNATRATKANKGELDEARITNEYRVMFGRGAVVVHDLLTLAAHGHCDDMARLGFFAHQSPVPGKASPWDRVKLTGMRALGVGENIAEASGPSGAHNGWCHSSGHHRNLLSSGWRLLGVGNVGHYWCQNFSAGEQKAGEPDEGGEDDK